MFRKMGCVAAKRAAVGAEARQRIRIQAIKGHMRHDDKSAVGATKKKSSARK